MPRSLSPHPAQPLTLATRASDGTVVLLLDGSLVAGSCEALSAWASRRLPSCTRRLVVDLSGLTSVDASGLGALVALRRRTSGEVVLHDVPAALRPALLRAGVLALLPELQAAPAPARARTRVTAPERLAA